MGSVSAMRAADIVVVGGGSAGAVVAARLSEDRSRRVLLVEAGPDTAPGATPKDIANTFPASYFNRRYFWPGLMSCLRQDEPPVPFAQPQVMGGGSSVGGMIALRGLPSDYDEWARREVLGLERRAPSFQGDDLRYRAADRNARGPNIVHWIPQDRWPLYIRRLEQTIAEQGETTHANVYDSADDGFFATPLSQENKRA